MRILIVTLAFLVSGCLTSSVSEWTPATSNCLAPWERANFGVPQFNANSNKGALELCGDPDNGVQTQFMPCSEYNNGPATVEGDVLRCGDGKTWSIAQISKCPQYAHSEFCQGITGVGRNGVSRNQIRPVECIPPWEIFPNGNPSPIQGSYCYTDSMAGIQNQFRPCGNSAFSNARNSQILCNGKAFDGTHLVQCPSYPDAVECLAAFEETMCHSRNYPLAECERASSMLQYAHN